MGLLEGVGGAAAVRAKNEPMEASPLAAVAVAAAPRVLPPSGEVDATSVCAIPPSAGEFLARGLKVFVHLEAQVDSETVLLPSSCSSS